MCAAAFGGLLSQPARAELPPIKHVFVIVLENHAESETFGAGSKAPYLATNLKEAGMFIPNYYGIGHSSLDNYIAMISGQAPNEATRADCGIFSAIPGEPPLVQGQEPLSGCIYPTTSPFSRSSSKRSVSNGAPMTSRWGPKSDASRPPAGTPRSVPRQHPGGDRNGPVCDPP